MELRELKYFLAVAETGSISAAAEYLYITQPSLSRQMQNLEREVGGQLFERGNRRITLTERGKLLKKRAEEMLELYGKTLAEVSAPSQEISGEVYISGGESPAVETVIHAAMNVRKAYPAVKFRFFSGDASAVTEKVDKGLADFGIVIDMPDTSSYNSLRLPGGDVWGVFVKRDEEFAKKPYITAADIADRTIITSDQAYARGLIAQWLGVPADKIDVAATYNLLYVGSQLAKAGAGYVLGLEGIINTEGTDLCFKRLEPTVRTHADVIWKKYGALTRAAEYFLRELKTLCATE